MIKNIRVNYEVLELMLVFWDMLAAREKVAEPFIIEIAEREEMKLFYDEENFSQESCRRVLSSLVNFELLNNASQDEKRFWNNNMWMLEDLGLTKMMLDPVKQLNFSQEKDSLAKDKEIEALTLVFVPGTTFDYIIQGDKVIVNFFKVAVDIFGGTDEVTFLEKPFKEAMLEIVEEAAQEL